MSSFEYCRPRTLEEALAAIAGDGAHALAGGTDLVLMRAAGDVEPKRLVDLKGVQVLSGITPSDPTTIGAATPLSRLSGNALTGLGIDALADGASLVGSTQTRCRATLGGNVCRSSPAGDTLAPLLVLAAEFELRSSSAVRAVPASVFFLGPGQNTRRPDELLTQVRISSSRSGSAYQRFTYRKWMDLAVVGVAASVCLTDRGCTGARIAISGAAPVPRLVPDAAAVLLGPEPADAVGEAARITARAAEPIDDIRGSASFRRDVLEPLTSGVLRLALARATADGSSSSYGRQER